MFGKTTVVISAIFCLALSACVYADNVMPKAADPQEHAALLKLAAMEREFERRHYYLAIQEADSILADRPNWSQKPWVELMKAKSQTGIDRFTEAQAASKELLKTYRESDPLLAAWAQVNLGDSRGMEIESYLGIDNILKSTQDKEPLLESYRTVGPKLEQLIDNEFPDVLLSALGHSIKERLAATVSDQEIGAWVHGVMCGYYAAQGDENKAWDHYNQLVSIVPPNDERIAIARIHMANSEVHYFPRTKNGALLSHAEQLVQETQVDFPSETWLIASGKLSLVECMQRERIHLAEAEGYAREVIKDASDTDLMPVAYTFLAETLYKEDKYAEAAAAAKAVVDKYPYSTWVDYTTFWWANCLHAEGKNDEALAALDQILNLYPGTVWAIPAKLNKEIFWK